MDQLGKSARLLLLDIAIGQGAGGAADLDGADSGAEAELDRHGFAEAFLPNPQAEWHGGYSGRRSARVTTRGRAWLQAVLESGRWRTTEADERGRWDKALAALRQGGTVWTAPVGEVLERGAEWGQTALADDAEDARVAAAVADVFAADSGRALALDRLIAAAPPTASGHARRAWLERADEIARAWGKPLFGPGAWMPGHSPATCPAVDLSPRTWKPFQMHPESTQAPVRA